MLAPINLGDDDDEVDGDQDVDLNDEIHGGGGNDTLTGGADLDYFLFYPTNNDVDFITDFRSDDFIWISGLEIYHPYPRDNELLTVTLVADQGTFSLPTGGLVLVGGDGVNDTSLTLSGSRDDLNAALADLTFTPVTGHVGNASLTMSATDHSGWSESRIVNVTVTDVKPVIADQTLTTPENSAAGTLVGQITVWEDDTGLTWSITGGTGQGLFTLDNDGRVRG